MSLDALVPLYIAGTRSFSQLMISHAHNTIFFIVTYAHGYVPWDH